MGPSVLSGVTWHTLLPPLGLKLQEKILPPEALQPPWATLCGTSCQDYPQDNFRAAMMGEDDKIKNTWGCQKRLKPWQTMGAPEEGPPWQGTPGDVEVDEGLSGYAQVYLHDLPGHFTPQVLRSEPGQEPVLISLKLWPPSSLNMCFEKSSSAACHTHICNTISRSPKEADSKPTSRGGWVGPSTIIVMKISARALFWMVDFFFFSVLSSCLINNHHLFGD